VNIWLVMLLAGALTFGMRFSFIYLFGRFEISAAVKRALRFVPPAVLSAIITPALFMPNNTLDLSWSNYRLMAGVVAGSRRLADKEYAVDHFGRHDRTFGVANCF